MRHRLRELGAARRRLSGRAGGAHGRRQVDVEVRQLILALPVGVFLLLALVASVDEEEGLDGGLEDEDGVLVARALQLGQALTQRLPQLL